MTKLMRQSSLDTLSLGNVIDIFENGKLPVDAESLIDKIFGDSNNRGALVISGSKGIVGAGKMMQLGVRLMEFGVPLVGLDMGGASDGLSFQYLGLVDSFGKKRADEIMSNIVQFHYDGKSLPKHLKTFNPKFLLEAIPEILEVKKTHYQLFNESFPGIQIKSVTSGFPMKQLGVGIAHPAFPHQINKIWEMVEDEPSDITKLFWALGMIPMEMTDNWAFVLDVLFCGLTLAGVRYHEATNMPFWKIDKYIRKYLGPNPFRAHDAIGAKGANFLTWSCLHHLSKVYGPLFTPAKTLVEHKDSGNNWYPLNHLRPVINWSMDDLNEFQTLILGPLFQMTSLILREDRSHYGAINAIGEQCAQFRKGVLAMIRSIGADNAIKIVEDYHKIHPEAAVKAWYPDNFKNIYVNNWKQLYVSAEHNMKVGIITISRESYNYDVDAELNRAIDWLKDDGIESVIISGDFHLATQLVGADTSEFYPALNDSEAGFNLSLEWSKTARRLHNEFKTSVAFINGKRCLGGMLELLLHCHYVVSTNDALLGAPEVTLPVVPGMELCHWTFRKAKSEDWHKLVKLLLSGKFVKAKESVGWLVDFAGTIEEALTKAWSLVNEGESIQSKRKFEEGALPEIPSDFVGIPLTEDVATNAARHAIFESIRHSCSVGLSEALEIQARHSAEFMTSKHCNRGFVGSDYQKTMVV
jgi:enoyl-CoA hydratase/carnithine racemase/3-hydroxyacyl-CoA dehydrogenase